MVPPRVHAVLKREERAAGAATAPLFLTRTR